MKTSCIVSPAKDPFIIVRKSWIEICEGNHCAAMLLNFFVNWHDWKKEHQPRAERENKVTQMHGDIPTQNTSLLQHHTVAELKDGLLGLFGDKTICKSITKLIELGFISQHRNPNPRYKFDQTYHYLVLPAAIQDAIDALSENTESIPHNEVMHSAKILYDSAITPNHTEKVPDASANLLNHYQDPFQETNQDPSQNTNPDARAEKGFGENFGRVENAPIAPVNPPPPIPMGVPKESIHKPLVQPNSITQSLEVTPVSGEEGSSGGCSTLVHGTTQKFNDSWNYSSDIGSLTAELVKIYNNGRPDNWTGVVGDSGAVRRKVEGLWGRYRSNGETNEKLIEDWKNALLWYRSSDFHTDKKFGAGNIFWLAEGERVEIAAAKWEGSGESEKRKVAIGILGRENGIPHWRTGEIMEESTVRMYRRTIPKMHLDHTDRPPIEWIKKYMPEILEKLSHEYN